MDRTSERLDLQYDQDLTGSDPLRLSEGHDDGSIDRPELTASPEKRSSESFSTDRKTSEAEVTQSPDTGRSEQHLPGEIETQSGIHPAPGQDKLKDDEPLNVHRQQPETSLGTSGDRGTDSPTIDTEVYTPGGREPDSTFSPASLPAAQEDIRFITDEPPTATDATGHHDAGLFTGKPPLKGPEKSVLSDDDQTVDEVDVETRESVSASPSMSHEQVRSRLASETDKTATGKLSPEATITGDELPEPEQMATTATVTEPAVTPHDLAPAPDDKQHPTGSPSLPLTDETVTTETPLRTTGETGGETTVEDRVEEIHHDQYRASSPLGSHPSRQGGVSGDSSTIDTDLETHTTEQEIIKQTSTETREELTIQDDSVVSRLKASDGRSAEKTTTELAPSTGGVSEKLDPEYDHSRIRSDSAHLPEEQEPLSVESQQSVVTTGSSSESDSDDETGRVSQARSHSRTSSDGKPDAGSPTIDPDLTVAAPLFTSEPSDHEDKDSASEGEGKDGWRTPPESLSRVISEDDPRRLDPEVLAETQQSTAPEQASLSPAATRQLTSQEDSNILTDVPPSATDETVEVDTTETQPLTAEQKRSTSGEQVITVEETVVETTVEDRVEEIHHDQYRTPSPLDSHPPQQGKATDDTSTVDTDLETKTTEREIIEQTRSETQEELTVQDDSAADVQASEAKTKDYRTIFSSVLKDLPSDRSAREADASAAEKTTTASAHSMDRTSERLDLQYEQDLTGSDPLRLSEGYAPRSEDRQSLDTSAESRETHRTMSPEAGDDNSIEFSERQTSLKRNDLLHEYQKAAKQSVGEVVDKALENIQHLSEEDVSDRLSPVAGSSNNTRLPPTGMISSLTETGLRPETEEAMHRMSESMREQVASESAQNLKSQDSMVESSKSESLSTASDVPEPVVTTYLPSDIDKQQSHAVRYTMTQTTKTTKEKTDEFITTETQRETTTDKKGVDNQSDSHDSHPDLSVKEKITDLDIPDTSEYVRQRSDSSSSSSASEGEYHIPQDPVDTEPSHRKLENIQELLYEELQQSSSEASGVDSDHIEDEDIARYSEGYLASMDSETRTQEFALSSMDSSLSLPAEADPDLMTQTIMHRAERKVDESEVRGADRENSGETTIDGKPQEAVTQQGKMSLLPTVSASTMEGSQLQQSSATLDPADGVQDEQSVVREQTLARSGFSTEHRTIETEGSKEFFSALKTLEQEVLSEPDAESSQTASEEPKTLATEPSTERHERFLRTTPSKDDAKQSGIAGEEPKTTATDQFIDRTEKFLTETKQQVSSDHQTFQKAASGNASDNTQPLDKLAEELVDKALHNVISEKEFQQTSTSEKSESPAAGQYTEHDEPRITQKTEQLRDLKLPSNEAMKPAETTELQETEFSAGDTAETITSKEKAMNQSLEKMVAELVSEDSDNDLSDERERHKSSIATGSSSDVKLSAAGVTGDSDEFKFRPQTDEDMERVSASMRKEHLKSMRTTTISVYMTKTERHKTEVKANVIPGRATEQQSIEHSVRSQITVGSTAPRKQVKWASSVDPTSPKETKQQEEPLKTETASASSLVESVIGAEKAEGVSTPSSSSDDLRTRTLEITHHWRGRDYSIHKETYPVGTTLEAINKVMDDEISKHKQSGTFKSNNPVGVELSSEVKGIHGSKRVHSFREGETKRVERQSSFATPASEIRTVKDETSMLIEKLRKDEAESDSETTRV